MEVLYLGITYFTMFVEADRVDLQVIRMSGNAWVFSVTKLVGNFEEENEIQVFMPVTYQE